MEPEELIARYRHLPDFHLTRVLGAWVCIAGGEVVEVDASGALDHCPLQRLLSDADVETYAREKIEALGHFTAERDIWRESLGVPFGTSEMMMYALRKGVLDAAVCVCDGAGTVVATVPEIVQGIGARMNGLFHTSPIPAVQARLRAHGCLLFDDARIDQVAGLRRAVEAGHRRVAVTVNGRFGAPLADVRQVETEAGAEVTLAVVCTTGASAARADAIVAAADVAWACASKPLREKSAGARLQLTQGIPVFVYTARGLGFLAAYSDDAGAALLRGLDPTGHYLLAARGDGPRIRLGEHRLALSEAPLPVRSRNEPSPLR